MEHDLGKVTRWGKVPAWWLLHPEMDADRFCVMAALATYADEDGYCEPSQATLARRLKRSRPWVNGVVAGLAECGLIEKTVRHRTNGGTTSCRYRLSLVPPEGVAETTPPVAEGDSPRHRGDTNHLENEQNQGARPGRAEQVRENRTEIEPSWRPPAEIEAEALRMYPDADLDEHTQLFVARSLAKGYLYRPGTEGRAWLAWLIEDRREARSGRSGRAGPVGAVGTYRTSRPADRMDRYSAWAAAAAMPSGHA